MAVLLPDGDIQEHSLLTTLGLWVLGTPLAMVPVPGHPTKGCLRERCQVLPQRPRSHSAPPSPYEDIIRRAPFRASALEDWCRLVDPLKMSISTPRAMQVAPSHDQATLSSTVSSLQQLDQGPIIRKLSRGG